MSKRTAVYILGVGMVLLITAMSHVIDRLAIREMLDQFESASGIMLPKSTITLHSEWTFLQSNHLRIVLRAKSDIEQHVFTNSLSAANDRIREQIGCDEFEYLAKMNGEAALGEKGLFRTLKFTPSEMCLLCAELGYGEERKTRHWAVAAEKDLIWIWFSKGH